MLKLVPVPMLSAEEVQTISHGINSCQLHFQKSFWYLVHAGAVKGSQNEEKTKTSCATEMTNKSVHPRCDRGDSQITTL